MMTNSTCGNVSIMLVIAVIALIVAVVQPIPKNKKYKYLPKMLQEFYFTIQQENITLQSKDLDYFAPLCTHLI